MAESGHDGPLSVPSPTGATWLATCAAAGSILLAGCAGTRASLETPTVAPWPVISTSGPAAVAAGEPTGLTPTDGGSSVDEAATGSGPAKVAATEELPPPKIKGTLSTRARARWAGNDHDVDLYGLLSVDVGDEAVDDYTAHVMGRVSYDVDANGDSSGSFSSIDDTYDSRLEGRLYDAWLDIHRVGPLKSVRVGRQTLWDTPELVVFDGAKAVTDELGDLRWSGGAYAGQTTHEFESSPDQDAVYGAFAQVRPWTGGRARLDAMNLRDDTNQGKIRNNLVGLNLWQSLGERVRLHTEYTRLDNAGRDAQIDGTYYDAPNDFLVQLSYKEFLQPQTRRVTELDPFFVVLQDYAPYHQSRVLASKGFDDDFSVEGGMDVRRLDDAGDEGPFNREFQRWFATGVIHYTPEVDVSVTGEVWDGDGESTSTWGLDLTKQADDDTKVSLGSYYSLFKSDFLHDEELEHVRTFYLRFKRQLDPASNLSLGYEYEDAEFQNLQTLTAKMTWRF